MNRILLHPVVLLVTASGVMLAQQTPAPAARDAYGQAQPSANRPPAAQPPSQAYGVPPEVTLRPGTMLTMRLGQKLADNKNAAGDTFSGPLTAPLVANGIVVAQRGSMVYGKVVEAQKVKGVHRLGVEITGITLADGSQAPVQGQLVARQAPPMPYWEQPRGNITTAAADGSAGGTVGVLSTKGHDSVLYPETLLTFRTGSAITVNTTNSAGAFRYVGPDDYSRPAGMTTRVATRPAYGYASPYPYYDYPYYGWGYPYPYWGPVGFGLGFGFGGFYGGGFHGGGFHGRFR